MMVRLSLLTIVAVTIPVSAIADQGNAQAAKAPPPVFELTPEAYMQLDWRGYPDWPVTPGSGRLEFDTFAVRRLRAGVNGHWRDVGFEVTLDPEDIDGTLVKDAYGEWRWGGGYEIRLGQFKSPGSRDYGTAARSLDFLERAGLGRSLAAQRDLGGMLHGDIGRKFDYNVGLFAGDNNGSTRRAGLTGAARVEWEPSNDLVVAGYMSEGRLTSVDTDPENGLEADCRRDTAFSRTCTFRDGARGSAATSNGARGHGSSLSRHFACGTNARNKASISTTFRLSSASGQR